MTGTKRGSPGAAAPSSTDPTGNGKIGGKNKAIAPSLQPPRKGGRRSRDKGNRTERALVRYLQEHAGLAAERVPLSGSAGGRYRGDISLPLLGRDLTAEVKARGNGFNRLYSWLEGRDLLFVRADRAEPLVILKLRLAAEIAVAAEQGRR
jgi:Holliday junction resolvase